MARVLIRYDGADEAFARRLARDLGENDVDFTLSEWTTGFSLRRITTPEAAEFDFCCVVLATRSRDSASKEIERLLRVEPDGGGSVLPLLLERVTLPGAAEHRKYADFTREYAVGLRQLLAAFGRISVTKVLDLPDYTIVSGRRGVAGRLGSFSSADGIRDAAAFASQRMTTQAISTPEATLVTLIEAVGDLTASRIVREVAQGIFLFRMQRGEISGSADHIRQLFLDVDRIVKDGNRDSRLTRSRRVGCKLSLVVLQDRVAHTASMGATGLLTRLTRRDGAIELARREPMGQASIDRSLWRDDDQALWARAPLGFLMDSGLEIQPQPFELSEPGDYVALNSFALPYVDKEVNALLSRINRYHEPSHLVRALARSHWPSFADCLSCVVLRT